jgi:hypothetical protein
MAHARSTLTAIFKARLCSRLELVTPWGILAAFSAQVDAIPFMHEKLSGLSSSCFPDLGILDKGEGLIAFEGPTKRSYILSL